MADNIVFDDEMSEAKLEISLEHFKNVQKMAKIGSWRMDFNTGMTIASEEAVNIYGLTSNIVPINEVKTVCLPEYREKLDKEMSNLIAGIGPYDIEFVIKRPSDGELRNVHSVAEYDPGSNMVTGIIQDISSRKKMEFAIAEGEKRYRELFDNSESGILYVALDGSILEANRKILTLLGSPSLEETKKINTLTFPLLEKIGFSASMQKVMNLKETIHDSVYYTSRWGSSHYLDYILTPIFEDNKLTAVMARIEDITERKIAEDKVEALLKEKDIILREVHHRIKNNMASIEGLLKLQVENNTNEEVRSELKDAVSRLTSMRILYEKLYQSEDFLETSSEAYLSKLIDDIAGVFPESSKIKFKKDIDDFMIPSEIIFSLGIIINELLTNALKYAFNEIVDEKIIFVSANKNNSTVNITVRDNGVGYSSPGKGRKGGFGIQLVSMLSEQIGGKAEFYNDNGAVFSINFTV